MTHGSPAVSVAATEFGRLESSVVDHMFELMPSYAVFLGLHTHDGRLPDLSRSATERWAAEADRLHAQLRAIPADELSAARRLDRTLLELLIESALFDLRESRDYDRNPMTYVGSLSLTAYMVRDYAPVPQRVDAMVRSLEATPAFLKTGLGRLDEVLPEPFLRLARSIGSGLAAHFAEAEELATRAAPALGARVRAARGPAEEAVGAFLTALAETYGPRATPNFALGPEKYQRMLWVREGVQTPFHEVEAAGRRDLQRNQSRLGEIAHAAGTPVETLLEGLYSDHPSPATLLPEARAFVDETRAFVEEHHLATIPKNASCRVEETPVYGRALSTASMNPPGPFDTGGDEGIYFVTPIDPAWTPDKQTEWLRSLNRPMLRNITAHEVYPGHYLQFLHFRAGANTLARRVYLSSSFAEGWAHYCEQLVIEAKLGAESPKAEAAQLHDALLRDCRLLASIGLHTGGMTLKEATELFQREAHMEELPAQREAIRGSFNPEYFCYTLGKLAILDARSRVLGSKFGGELRRFHDTLLGFGCPPVGMLGELFGAV